MGHGGNAVVEVVTPDPDLGWRRVQSAAEIPAAHYRNGSSAAVLSGRSTKEWCTRAGGAALVNGAVEQQYPSGWLVYFFNDRSGNCCQTSLITLAINIAIRAEQLARAFGILNEPTSSEGHLNSSSSLILSKLESSRRHIFVALGIPDFGWCLLSRNEFPTPLDNTARSSPQGALGKRSHRGDRSGLSSSSNPPLQLLQSGGGTEKEKILLADVPAIGMNIAEQLHRLERKRDNRHFLPTDAFGWTHIGPGHQQNGLDVMVASPTGEAISLVPEEMIMNTTQWVQQTYFTSALL